MAVSVSKVVVVKTADRKDGVKASLKADSQSRDMRDKIVEILQQG
jgi:hypothetical protein